LNPTPIKAQPSGSRSPTKEDGLHEVIQVLVVEDNQSDVYLIRCAIDYSGLKTHVTVLKDGELARKFCEEVDLNAELPTPDLIILDLNLPKLRGAEVLEHMRRSPRCQEAVVIVVSTTASESEQKRVSILGANAYFRKPSVFDEFLKLGDLIRTLFSEKGFEP
jgi:chemotaxis family two-component system response regulator Rcp1